MKQTNFLSGWLKICHKRVGVWENEMGRIDCSVAQGVLITWLFPFENCVIFCNGISLFLFEIIKSFDWPRKQQEFFIQFPYLCSAYYSEKNTHVRYSTRQRLTKFQNQENSKKCSLGYGNHLYSTLSQSCFKADNINRWFENMEKY